MSKYGYIVVGGLSFEITSVTLLAGKLHLNAERDGPFPAIDNALVTIFGSDGLGFLQGIQTASIAEVPEGCTGCFAVDIAMLESA